MSASTRLTPSRPYLRLLLVALLALLTLAALPPAPAQAAACTVTNPGDSGAGTLRTLLANGACDSLTFALPGPAPWTIILTSGELTLTRNLTITGPGADSLTISGNAASRIFNVTSGSVVQIAGLTIANGRTNNDSGGGVKNKGTLTLTDAALRGNYAGVSGGGIENDSGVATLTNVTVSGNSAFYYSGGISNYKGTLTVLNSTISGNAAGHSAGPGGLGNYLGTVALSHVTVARNNPGGLSNLDGGATMTVARSVVAGNASYYNCKSSSTSSSSPPPPIVSGGYNVVGSGCPTDGPGDGVAPGTLAALADPALSANGGPTLTHALVPGSAAIDRIPLAQCNGGADQRGVARPQGSGCDSGATEFRERPTTLVVAAATGTFGGTATLQATLTESAGGAPLAGQVVGFTLGGFPACDTSGQPACPTTDASGVAQVAGVGLVGSNVGVHPTGIGASTAPYNEYLSSTATGALTVTSATQAITFAQPPDQPFGDPPFVVSATGGGSGQPVTFATTTPAACAVGAPTTPTSATVTLLAAGDCTLVASQAGDANHTAAPPVSRTFAVGQATQAITFAQPPDQPFGDPPFVVSATGGGSGQPVTFATTTPAACAVGAPTTPTSATVTLLAAGDCTLVASQDGDANYAAAPPVSRTFAVAKAAQTITFAEPPGRPAGDPPFTVDATASSGLAVTFTAGPSGVCSAAGATITLLGPGTCTITAHQPGDATYLPAPDVSHSLVSLTVAAQGPGGVSPGGSYPVGTVVTLVATPDPGAIFTGWTVDGAPGGAANPLTLTLDAPRSVTATFTTPSSSPSPSPSSSPVLTLVVAGGGAGTVASNPARTGGGPFAYPAGTSVTLTPQPAAGSVFTGWTVDGVGRGWAVPLILTMDAPHTVVATFAPAAGFADVPSTRAEHAAIVALATRGFIRGYADGRYGPDDGVQRAQMAALIARAMPAGPGTPPATLAPPACLVPGSWDCEEWGTTFADRNGLDPNLWRNIGALQHYGVARGYAQADCAARGKAFPCFGPTDPVTYAETVVFITRAMVAKGYWAMQPGAPQPHAGVPAVFAPEVATFHHYTQAAGGVPAPPANWNAQASRGWFAMALWTALDSHWGGGDMP